MPCAPHPAGFVAGGEVGPGWVVVTGLGTPIGIAVDPAGGKVYWADMGPDKIQRKNLDGSGSIEDVATGLGDNPVAVAVDPTGGKVY